MWSRHEGRVKCKNNNNKRHVQETQLPKTTETHIGEESARVKTWRFSKGQHKQIRNFKHSKTVFQSSIFIVVSDATNFGFLIHRIPYFSLSFAKLTDVFLFSFVSTLRMQFSIVKLNPIENNSVMDKRTRQNAAFAHIIGKRNFTYNINNI